MKQTIIIIACLTLSFSSLSAQTYLKANAAYWAIGISNLSAETRLSDQWTLSGELVYSPWENLFNNNKFKFLQFNPDVRWYPKGIFNGFYTGIYASLQDFKMTKWNYINRGLYQDGWGYGFGTMLGFQTSVSNRWTLDVHLGGGWHHGRYRGYKTGTGEMYKNWNGSGEWLPYRLGITFGYLLK